MKQDPNGNCYIASEVAQHLLGKEKWKPCQMWVNNFSHWFLKNRETGEILDLTETQFDHPINHEKGRGKGFLTKGLSRRSKELLERL